MKIGNLEFKNNIFLGPMAGFTDYPFRRICKGFGAALTYTEMVSAKALYYGDKKTQVLLVPEDNMCSVQIFGREPQIMKYAAQLLQDKGVPMIDVNMGCPAPKIVNNGEGSALLKEPELAVEIIETLKKSVSIPVTVKMRMGWDSCPDVALALSKRMCEAGVDAICIHGRTREQYYSGKADWNIIKAVKESVSCPVIGNGDVRSYDDCKKMLDTTGCDAVMISRAAAFDPRIFEECISGVKKSTNFSEKIELISHHYELCMEFYGEHMAIPQMRKQFHCYIKGMPDAARLKNEINKINSYEEIKQFLKNLPCA